MKLKHFVMQHSNLGKLSAHILKYTPLTTSMVANCKAVETDGLEITIVAACFVVLDAYIFVLNAYFKPNKLSEGSFLCFSPTDIHVGIQLSKSNKQRYEITMQKGVTLKDIIAVLLEVQELELEIDCDKPN